MPPLTVPYRGTSLIRKRLALGTYSRTLPVALWWSLGCVGRFLMSEVPMYPSTVVRAGKNRAMHNADRPLRYRGTSLIRNTPS